MTGTAGRPAAREGSRRPSDLRRDEGFATVAAAGVGAVLVVLLGLLLQCGAVVAARHEAEHAADLAALAGVGDGVLGPELGCARARDVATANGAELVACRWSGWTLAVEVLHPCSCPLPVSAPSPGRARAGPLGDGTPR